MEIKIHKIFMLYLVKSDKVLLLTVPEHSFPALSLSLDDGDERNVYVWRFLVPVQVSRPVLALPL